MEIMELATELGKKIKEDARMVKYKEISDKYEADTALADKVSEYNAESAALSSQYQKKDKDLQVIDAIEKRIMALYEEITKNPLMAEYQEAQTAVNNLMNEVNGEISFQITGERPCNHSDCGSCSGGCSGHHH